MHATLRVATGFVLLLIACCVSEAGTVEGMWRTTGNAERLRLQLMWGDDRNHNNSSMRTSAAEMAALRAPGSGPVSFSIVREAGTFQFDGKWKGTQASGDFTFTPDSSVIGKPRASGVSIGKESKWSRDETFISLAVFDVSTAHVKELRELGYQGLTIDDLIGMRIHGVDGAYIRALQREGYRKIEQDTLVGMRIHGVTPEYIAQLKLLGYASVSTDDLVSTRIHGVTPEFIREMAQLGYRTPSLEDLVAMRIHGVTPRYIREMSESGFVNLTIDELVSLRIHGIDSRYAKAMRKPGKKN